MPTVTEDRQPTIFTSLKGVAAGHPVIAFLVMAYAFGWPTLLAGHYSGLPFLLASSLGMVFGLALPAFLVKGAMSGKAGVRDLLRRSLRWRVGIQWYLLALLGLPVITLLVASVFLVVAPLQALAEKWPLFFTMFLPGILIPFALIQLFEEAGWTGFMQHTLQDRHGPLLASILVVPAFALFHLPLDLIETPQILIVLVQVAVQAVASIFLRVVIMWLYNSSGRSVLIVALFHSAFNSLSGSHVATGFIRELIAGPTALVIGLAVGAVVAVLVTVLTKGRLGYEPGRGAAPRPAGGVASQPRVQ
jgi:membrane protease YdiL (CAAX protease family)